MVNVQTTDWHAHARLVNDAVIVIFLVNCEFLWKTSGFCKDPVKMNGAIVPSVTQPEK